MQCQREHFRKVTCKDLKCIWGKSNRINNLGLLRFALDVMKFAWSHPVETLLQIEQCCSVFFVVWCWHFLSSCCPVKGFHDPLVWEDYIVVQFVHILDFCVNLITIDPILLCRPNQRRMEVCTFVWVRYNQQGHTQRAYTPIPLHFFSLCLLCKLPQL